MRLNLRALTEAQLQAAAMEAGAPLKDLLPDNFHSRTQHELYEYVGGGQAATTAPTHYRMGMMINLLGNFAYSFSIGQHGSSRSVDGSDVGRVDSNQTESGGDDLTMTMDELQMEEKRYFMVRIAAALVLFFTFWLVRYGLLIPFWNAS
jgi:potassium channel subfamily K